MHTRDFLPDDVSELSSVAAVEDAVGGADAGGGAIVLVVVVVVVRIGCRQQDEEDTDVDVVAVTVAAAAAASSVVAFDAAAAEDADVTVFVDSFAPIPCTAVFNIFSSPSPTGPWRAAANAHLGHSPTLNGCSSLL